MSTPAALDDLMPHRAPMQWINALTACTETAATATACFKKGDFAMDGGALLETALVECVAQTVAAALGHRAQGGANRALVATGMLVGVSNFKIQMRPTVGETLRIDIRELKRLGAMVRIAGSVRCGERLVASGELSLYA